MSRIPVLSTLFEWEGTVGRGQYFGYGATLFALKYTVDRVVAKQVFHRPWTPLNYYEPAGAFSIVSLPASEQRFFYTMLAIAIPFIWFGVLLTVKRLRDLGYPLGWTVLFFVPFVNLLFFVVLSILPGDSAAASATVQATSYWENVAPESKLGAAFAGVLLCTPIALLLTLFGVKVLANYGWGLFVGVPFVVGFVSVAVYNLGGRRRKRESIAVSMLALLIAGTTLLFVAIEGAVCLLMALPIAAPIAMMGGALAHSIFSRPLPPHPVPQVFGALVLALPMLMAGEQGAHLPPRPIAIHSEVVVNAPPQKVWNQLIAFAQIPDQREWLFHTGVAYPIRAEIQGHGPGAVRYCVFSTGAFVEPIEVWDEPHRLSFSVRDQPPVMQEWSPYDIKPAHLAQNYLLSRRGEFRLTELPGGRTRLEGTTWYENRFWPGAYWQVWSDYFIHRIHMRVLEHIKTLAER
ncbi:MAG: SRPBCC family protein [Acidobacteriia bacterium]|nr:SRPBCC family protein [Terriglobia bacterium]